MATWNQAWMAHFQPCLPVPDPRGDTDAGPVVEDSEVFFALLVP